MFNYKSIKFRVITVVILIIILVLSSIAFSWYTNSNNMNEQLVRDTQKNILKYLDKKNSQLIIEKSEHLQYFLGMIAEIVAYDAYNLDYEGIQEDLNRFINHDGICSISIRDVITDASASAINNSCAKKASHQQSIAVNFHGKKIAELYAEYHTEYIEEIIDKDNQFWQNALSILKMQTNDIYSRFMWIQFTLLAIGGLALVVWVSYQLQKSVVSPISKLLLEMQDTKSLVDLSKPLKEAQYNSEEIGQLAKYFHQHIRKLLSELHFKANVDALTKLASRQKLLDDLKKPDNAFLAILDINDFKEVNNSFGSDIGDKILQNLAEALVSFFGKKDFTFYRLSADEFAIICSKEVHKNYFKQLIEAFIDDYENKELNIKGNVFTITLCAGLSDMSQDPRNTISFTLLAVKYSKAHRLVLTEYDEKLHIVQKYKENIATTKMIKKALKRNKIIPYYQALQNINTGQIIKYEALMRIKDEDENIISPALFLDISRKSALYGKISKKMVASVFDDMKDHEYEISINLSIEDILNEKFCRWLIFYIKNNNLGKRVLFEITEQEGVDNFDIIRSFIAKIKKYGAKVAIDDFGSGYSNFENLIHLDIDYLKIDGSLIKNIQSNEASLKIVKTITAFAKELKIQTVAEFVSSNEIYEIVKSLGIDFAQGYYIDMPKEKISKDSL